MLFYILHLLNDQLPLDKLQPHHNLNLQDFLIAYDDENRTLEGKERSDTSAGYGDDGRGRQINRMERALSEATGRSPEEGKKGISIQGTLGQEIKSIAKGKVIYSGEDLKGYGKLIIVKHDDDILSVYGHNRELFVTEGQSISAGEIISTMGQTEADEVILHFEIRKNGSSVNPMDYFKSNS